MAGFSRNDFSFLHLDGRMRKQRSGRIGNPFAHGIGTRQIVQIPNDKAGIDLRFLLFQNRKDLHRTLAVFCQPARQERQHAYAAGYLPGIHHRNIIKRPRRFSRHGIRRPLHLRRGGDMDHVICPLQLLCIKQFVGLCRRCYDRSRLGFITHISKEPLRFDLHSVPEHAVAGLHHMRYHHHMMLLPKRLRNVRNTLRSDHNRRLLPSVVDPLHTLFQHILLG